MKAARTDAELRSYDPFSGDKDDGGWKHERRSVVTTRKPAPCLYDRPHPILVGSRAVRYSAVCRGEGWRSFLICADCISRDIEEWG